MKFWLFRSGIAESSIFMFSTLRHYVIRSRHLVTQRPADERDPWISSVSETSKLSLINVNFRKMNRPRDVKSNSKAVLTCSSRNLTVVNQRSGQLLSWIFIVSFLNKFASKCYWLVANLFGNTRGITNSRLLLLQVASLFRISEDLLKNSPLPHDFYDKVIETFTSRVFLNCQSDQDCFKINMNFVTII